MKKIAIHLGGEQGAGKTSGAAFIKELFLQNGYYVHVIKFADPLYEMHDYVENKMQEIRNIPRVKKNGTLLQKLGTEIGRDLYGQNVWVDYAQRQAEEFAQIVNAQENTPTGVAVIFEDTRFENELMMGKNLLEKDWITRSIFFLADEEKRKDRVESFRPDTKHRSESDVRRLAKMANYTIETNGPEEEKNSKLAYIMSQEGWLQTPRDRLNDICEVFNSLIKDWSTSTGCGANFMWQYDDKGMKKITITDIAELKPMKPEEAAVAATEVQKKMESLDEQQEL